MAVCEVELKTFENIGAIGIQRPVQAPSAIDKRIRQPAFSKTKSERSGICVSWNTTGCYRDIQPAILQIQKLCAPAKQHCAMFNYREL